MRRRETTTTQGVEVMNGPICPGAVHVVRIRFLPVTDTKPARAKLISCRFGDSVIVSRHRYEEANHAIDTACLWLKEHGYTVIGAAEDITSDQDSFVVVEEFAPLREARQLQSN